MVISLGAILLAGYMLTVAFMWLTWVGLTGSEGQALFTPFLEFPISVSVAGQYFKEFGTLLLIVLVGALIGSEYTYGTHRLSLARGVSRGQLMGAQVVAVAILALISSGALLLLGAVVGAFGSLGTSGGQPLTAAGLGELALFWLAIALNAFVYSLIALWLATLGHSVAAAIAGPLVYIAVELIASSILLIFRYAPNPDPMTRLISAIPDYLLATNTNEVITLSGRSPYALQDQSAHLGLAHALIILCVYVVLFIASSYFVFRARDVRE